jgi:putative heme-binding domain-containing protein
LIALVASGELAAELLPAASTALRVAPWPAIQEETAKHLPSPPDSPSLGELMAMQGDAARGAEVAALPQTACLACHKIGDAGVDFGPGLTEIGNKLSRDALFTAIIDPAESISHGYRGWRIVLKSGASRAGFIVSETDAAIGLKEPSGNVTRIALEEIESRDEIPGSLMPPGLDRSMSPQQLVDLVDYLATLKP